MSPLSYIILFLINKFSNKMKDYSHISTKNKYFDKNKNKRSTWVHYRWPNNPMAPPYYVPSSFRLLASTTPHVYMVNHCDFTTSSLILPTNFQMELFIYWKMWKQLDQKTNKHEIQSSDIEVGMSCWHGSSTQSPPWNSKFSLFILPTHLKGVRRFM